MNTEPTAEQTILQQAKASGYTEALMWVLEVIEPIAPLAAQCLWVLQPTARLWGAHTTLQALATVLEEPHGAARLRQALHDDTRQEG